MNEPPTPLEHQFATACQALLRDEAIMAYGNVVAPQVISGIEITVLAYLNKLTLSQQPVKEAPSIIPPRIPATISPSEPTYSPEQQEFIKPLAPDEQDKPLIAAALLEKPKTTFRP